jgi:serine/threonine protein kinase
MVSRRIQSNQIQLLSSQEASVKQEKERAAFISREIRTIREASIMLLLDHPNIAQVYELMLLENYYYLFMEYIDGGQLLDYIISHGKLKEKQARDFSRQIASALGMLGNPNFI